MLETRGYGRHSIGFSDARVSSPINGDTIEDNGIRGSHASRQGLYNPAFSFPYKRHSIDRTTSGEGRKPVPRDFYVLLGVSRGAGLKRIKNAYRTVVKRVHPNAAQSISGKG
jgi:hypothetical protein